MIDPSSRRRQDLDDLSEGEYYQSDNFTMTINIEPIESVQPYPILWEDHSKDKYKPEIIFSSKLETDEMTEAFGKPLDDNLLMGVLLY
jgi:hypothetical protein